MNDDQVFEVYVRDVHGQTEHMSLRGGLKQFLGPDGYRLSINIEGIVITLRNSWDIEQIRELDSYLDDSRSIECVATVRGKLT